jgi:hypothetical protein
MISDNIEILQDTGYGASELKRIYQKYFIRGLIGAVIIHGIGIGTYLFANYLTKLSEEKDKQVSKE